MIDKENIKKSLESILEKEGIVLFDIKFAKNKGADHLQVALDYPQGGIDLNACARMNNLIRNFLESKMSFDGDNLVLEVFSPGIDKVFSDYKSFYRVKGKRISIWLKNSNNLFPDNKKDLEAKKYLEGLLKEVNDKNIVLNTKKGELNIDFNNISKAKQILI